MRDATYRLGKHRVYLCPACGDVCCRPLQAADTTARPFPVPCECGKELGAVKFQIVDTTLYLWALVSGRATT